MQDRDGGTRPGGAVVLPFPTRSPETRVTFGRSELTAILKLYGRMVAAGEWRDYAIEFTPARAVFAIYRRTSELPLYRIVKDPALARRQGMYTIETTGRAVLKRGHELARVLRVLEKPLDVVG